MQVLIKRATPDAAFQKSLANAPVKGWGVFINSSFSGVYPTQAEAQAQAILKTEEVTDLDITIDCRG